MLYINRVIKLKTVLKNLAVCFQCLKMEVVDQLREKGYTVFCLFEEIERKVWKIYIEKPARFSSLAIVGVIQEIGYNVTIFDNSFPGLLCIHYRNGPPINDYLIVTETGCLQKIMFGTFHIKFGSNLVENK